MDCAVVSPVHFTSCTLRFRTKFAITLPSTQTQTHYEEHAAFSCGTNRSSRIGISSWNSFAPTRTPVLWRLNGVTALRRRLRAKPTTGIPYLTKQTFIIIQKRTESSFKSWQGISFRFPQASWVSTSPRPPSASGTGWDITSSKCCFRLSRTCFRAAIATGWLVGAPMLLWTPSLMHMSLIGGTQNILTC